MYLLLRLKILITYILKYCSPAFQNATYLNVESIAVFLLGRILSFIRDMETITKELPENKKQLSKTKEDLEKVEHEENKLCDEVCMAVYVSKL